jgi:hypothetical protein
MAKLRLIAGLFLALLGATVILWLCLSKSPEQKDTFVDTAVTAENLTALQTAITTATTTLDALTDDKSKQRSATLKSLKAQLASFSAAVTASTMTLVNIPITSANATTFLAAKLTDTAIALPTLITSITVNTLVLLQSAIRNALTTLGSASDDKSKKRFADLTTVSAQLKVIVDNLAAGTTTLASVPITATNATAFLATPLTDTTALVPTLITPSAYVPPATVPSNSDGAKSLPADLTNIFAALGIGGGALQQGNSFRERESRKSTDEDREVAKLKDQVLDLQEENEKQQQKLEKYQALAEKKRCPDISQYIRKDSIPCYNCTL